MPFSPIDPDNIKGNLGQAGQTLPNSVGIEALNFNIANAAGAALEAHINNPLDAHMASAIGLKDIGNYYAVDALTGQKNVEDALESLGSLIPPAPNVIGINAVTIPNSGFPNYGTPISGFYLASAGSYAFTVGNVATGLVQSTGAIINNNLASGSVTLTGIMYPADQGYLAIYTNSTLLASFNIGGQFNNALRNTSQPNFSFPTVAGVTLTLTNRFPYLNNYTPPPYSGAYLPYTANFFNFQIATYSITITGLAPNTNGLGNFYIQQTKSSPPVTFSISAPAFSVINSTTELLNLYLDNGPTPPTVDISTLTGNLRSSASPLVFLSGVSFYGLTASDAFSVHIQSTNSLFNQTYKQTALLTVAYPGMSIATASIPYSSLVDGGGAFTPIGTSGTNAPLFGGSATPGIYNITPVIPGSNAFSISAGTSTTDSDPFGTSGALASTPTTASMFMLDTYLQTAPAGGSTNGITDDYTDSFVSEVYRFSNNNAASGSQFTNDFNSTPITYRATSTTFPVTPPVGMVWGIGSPNANSTFIDADASTTGALQCAALSGTQTQNGLVWPSINFSGGYPQGSTGTPHANPNYSTIAQPTSAPTDRFYYRLFDTKGSQTQLLLSVQGITTANFASVATQPPIQISIKIPGTTAWFDLGTNTGSTSPAGYIGTSYVVLNGCQDSSVPGHNPSIGIYGMSYGGASTGSGNATIAVRVRYFGTTPVTPNPNTLNITQLQVQF